MSRAVVMPSREAVRESIIDHGCSGRLKLRVTNIMMILLSMVVMFLVTSLTSIEV